MRRRRAGKLLRLSISALALSASTIPILACARELPVAVLYGDSLGFEAGPYLTKALSGRTATRVAAVPGAALCDLLPMIADDARRHRPDIAILEFSGNNTTPCMAGTNGRPLTGSALIDKYATDAEQAVTALRGADIPVYLVGAPRSRNSTTASQINDRYIQIADRWSTRGEDVHYVDAGAAVLLADGSFTEGLPCLSMETADMGCTGGLIRVRADDGVHFCPTNHGPTQACPVWSSGAYRFARAMAEPVRSRLANSLL